MKKVALILGGGRMGSGIAQVLATARYEVFVLEANADQAAAARERVANGLARASEHHALSEPIPTVLECEV